MGFQARSGNRVAEGSDFRVWNENGRLHLASRLQSYRKQSASENGIGLGSSWR